MKHGGIATEYTYGQYLAQVSVKKSRNLYSAEWFLLFFWLFFIRSTQDGRCHSGTIGAKIESYVNVTSGDLEALKIAIAQKGPVAVGIDASHRSFAFYSFGVYYEPQCGTS